MATKDELTEVKADLKFIKETVIKIKYDHGQKLGALFDGDRQYIQLSPRQKQS